ncbi:MAG: SIS domain-containing protein [Alkalispirochaeta sp.]
MNESPRYNQFALCREMLETASVVSRFDRSAVAEHLPVSTRVMLTGEGSSRIFPAKRLMSHALREGWSQHFVTEGASQAREYDLREFHVYVASNSGKTAEGVALLHEATAARTTGVVAHGGTPIATGSDSAFVLGCGAEDAVAATKSVVEQALFYDELFREANGAAPVECARLGEAMDHVLQQSIPQEIIDAAVAAPVVYFAGRNDGVAEELTLKTNEITRKRSDFLEGTYAVHGIEEVMRSDELVILVDPFPHQEEKFREVLQEGVGMTVVAIAPRETAFPTIRIPAEAEAMGPYLQLAAGWNMLVEIGIAAGIDIDKPDRARKVGNEFTG